MCELCGRERGRAEAAHLLGLPQGALLRAALPEGGLGRPQSRVQAAAGGRCIGATFGLLHAMQLDVASECALCGNAIILCDEHNSMKRTQCSACALYHKGFVNLNKPCTVSASRCLAINYTTAHCIILKKQDIAVGRVDGRC